MKVDETYDVILKKGRREHRHGWFYPLAKCKNYIEVNKIETRPCLFQSFRGGTASIIRNSDNKIIKTVNL